MWPWASPWGGACCLITSAFSLILILFHWVVQFLQFNQELLVLSWLGITNCRLLLMLLFKTNQAPLLRARTRDVRVAEHRQSLSEKPGR